MLFLSQTLKVMEKREVRRKNKYINTWVAIGAIVLIILLIVWLTVADFFGDTDVAAAIMPFV